ncbi:MAG TPA: hypothetical protein VIN40_08510 [Candidatus Tyrphobacter sp.]
MRGTLAILLSLALLAAEHRMAVARFATRAFSLLPASRVALRLIGIAAPERVAVVGVGSIRNGEYVVPSNARPGSATLVAADANALAVRRFRIVAPPRLPVIAVAAYDDGIVFHDPRTFASLGTLATGGSPSDVTMEWNGSFAATDTDGGSVTIVAFEPWSVRAISGVSFGDELLADAPLHALFVTERDLDGKGGLARVDERGVTTVVTGTTAEGIALDRRRQRVFVADSNDGSVAIVDARRMRVLARVTGIPRAFSLALSPDGLRLYAVSNQGRTTIFGAPGRVTAIALGGQPHVLARSPDLTFPVGVALDAAAGRLFVTDEEANAVDVLDARTLRPRRRPISTCAIPWKPTLDSRARRLYVPCAGSDEVDVIDARTLSRVHGAPFHTGGYPLAVSVP